MNCENCKNYIPKEEEYGAGDVFNTPSFKKLILCENKITSSLKFFL